VNWVAGPVSKLEMAQCAQPGYAVDTAQTDNKPGFFNENDTLVRVVGRVGVRLDDPGTYSYRTMCIGVGTSGMSANSQYADVGSGLGGNRILTAGDVYHSTALGVYKQWEFDSSVMRRLKQMDTVDLACITGFGTGGNPVWVEARMLFKRVS